MRVRRCLAWPQGRSHRTFPEHPELHSVFGVDRRLDALPPGSRDERWLEASVVRVALPTGRWPDLVTDLAADEVGPAALEATYRMRWGEETAFAHLKHAVGLDAPRTRDWGRAVRELWGRLMPCDACSLGTSGVPAPAAGRAHPRATDRTAAFKAFLRMLRSLVRRLTHDVEACLARMSHSVREGRSHERRRRPKSPPRSCDRHLPPAGATTAARHAKPREARGTPQPTPRPSEGGGRLGDATTDGGLCGGGNARRRMGHRALS